MAKNYRKHRVTDAPIPKAMRPKKNELTKNPFADYPIYRSYKTTLDFISEVEKWRERWEPQIREWREKAVFHDRIFGDTSVDVVNTEKLEELEEKAEKWDKAMKEYGKLTTDLYGCEMDRDYLKSRLEAVKEWLDKHIDGVDFYTATHIVMATKDIEELRIAVGDKWWVK